MLTRSHVAFRDAKLVRGLLYGEPVAESLENHVSVPVRQRLDRVFQARRALFKMCSRIRQRLWAGLTVDKHLTLPSTSVLSVDVYRTGLRDDTAQAPGFLGIRLLRKTLETNDSLERRHDGVFRLAFVVQDGVRNPVHTLLVQLEKPLEPISSIAISQITSLPFFIDRALMLQKERSATYNVFETRNVTPRPKKNVSDYGRIHTGAETPYRNPDSTRNPVGGFSFQLGECSCTRESPSPSSPARYRAIRL